MLTEIRIKNLALLQKVEMTFNSTFNVISGETGSGKSLLLKALNLLMGSKADSQTVSLNAELAEVEGIFDLSERYDIIQQLHEKSYSCEESQMVVRRIISKNGKSRVYINDRLSTLSLLKSIVHPLLEFNMKTPLIEVTGQHDNKYLQTPGYHLDLLDAFIGLSSQRKDILFQYQQIKQLRQELEEKIHNQKHLIEKLDYLEFQKKELDTIALQDGEIEDLEIEIKRAKNHNKNRDCLKSCSNLITDSDYSAFNLFSKIKSYLLKLDSKETPALLESIEQITIQLEDFSYSIESLNAGMNDSDRDLDAMEDRLHGIRRLQKKYGNSFEDINLAQKKIEQEIYFVTHFEQEVAKTQKYIDNLEAQLLNLCLEVHETRKKAAKHLSISVNKELKSLNMKGVHFLVDIQKEGYFSSTGVSRVRFLIESGQQKLAIDKYASGGELSRILLSLKKVIGQSSQPRTFLFDEIDSGVSGETAQKVGKKLFEISKTQQVICITHLPQVASFAHTHYTVDKKVTKQGPLAVVKKLTKQEQVQEIARLISGSKISETSLEHAEQLIDHVV